MGQVSREEAVATLAAGRERLLALLGRLGEDERERRGTIGGGDWSAKDLLGHVAYWQELALDSLAAWRRGEVPWAEAEVFRGPDGAEHAPNAADVERKRALPYEEVLEVHERTFRALIVEFHGLDDETWWSKAPYPAERRNRLGTMLGAVLGSDRGPFTHAEIHDDDLAAYVGSLNP